MKKEELNDPYYQKEAKRLVDVMFDTKLFRDDLTRDDMQKVEDLLAYYLDIGAKTARKCAELQYKLDSPNTKTQP